MDQDVKIICDNCGAYNDVNSAYCSACGQKLDAPLLEVPAVQENSGSHEEPYEGERFEREEKNQQKQSGSYSYKGKQPKSILNYNFDMNDFDGRFFDVSDKEVNEFLGTNQGYYFGEFNKMRAMNKTSSWNWVAFFFPILWLAYRKMYLLSLFTFVISAVLGSMGMGVIANWAINIMWGFYGNVKYLEYMQNSFIEADMLDRGQGPDFYLKSKGGTSTVALVVTALLTIGAVIIPMMILFGIIAGTSFWHYY